MLRVALLSSLAACAASPSSSPSATTSQLSVTGTFAVDRSALSAQVTVTSTSDPSYQLGPDDHLSIQFRDVDKDIEPSSGNVGFGLTLFVDGPVAADEPVSVTFEHGGQLDVLQGTFPPPFDLALPVQGSLSQPLEVTWAPLANDPMSWRVEGCAVQGSVGGHGMLPTDTGIVDVPASMLASADWTGPCDASFELDRTRTTRPPSMLSSASITVTQRAHGDVTLTP